MPGSEIFIVNGKRELLPGNQRGEIIIAGPNVSPGYLARPELTADAFFNIVVSALIAPATWGACATISFFSKAAWMSKSS